jgi:osmotically-inducible protein OsmY
MVEAVRKRRNATDPVAARIPVARPAPRPRVVLVGRRPKVGRVATALGRQLAVEMSVHGDLESASSAIDRRTLAVMLVSPLAKLDDVDALKQVRESIEPSEVPCFIVLPRAATDRRARALYRAGAAAVFEWPKEALIIPEVVERALGSGLRLPRQAGTAEDRRLAAAIRARLRIAPEPGDEVRVKVRDGYVALAGTVDRLRRKQRVEQYVADLPGVRHVNITELNVAPSKQSDAELKRTVTALVKRLVDPKTAMPVITVTGGIVCLAGVATSRASSERLFEVVSNVPGVQRIIDQFVIDPKAEHDPMLQRRLQRLCAQAFPHDDVRVDTFGDVAIVRGKVDRLRAKIDAESLLKGSDRISHVVNKLEVRA